MGNSVLSKHKQWLAGTLSGIFMLAAPGLAFAGVLPPHKEKPSGPTIPYSSFVHDVKAGQADEVIVTGSQAKMLLGGAWIQTEVPDSENVYQTLKGSRDSSGNEITIAAEASDDIPTEFFSSIMGDLLIGGAIIGAGAMLKGGMQKANPAKKSVAVLHDDPGKRVTFQDVAGIDEAMGDLEDIVDYLRNPAKYRSMGAKMPKGVLLVGPPGTGKTLIARALAGEANVPFFSIAGSDFVEMYVGVGASRVRDMFEEGKKNTPCIIFIDEIDAVGKQRGKSHGSGNDERENTLNQLLVEMDGFQGDTGIILVAATNRPDILDEALTRPGRFDRQVVVPNPDIVAREKILRVHMRKVRVAADVNPTVIARGTPGFSGAALANLVNEAALRTVKAGKHKIGMAEFEGAKDKIMMGAERRNLVMSEEERRMTAYHEAGHALVALNEPQSDPVHKATILPRGRSLGMMMRLPEADRHSMSKAKLKAELSVAMAGRVAEELIFGEDNVATGAGGDIKMASNIARAMVTEYGMSPVIGMVDATEGHSSGRDVDMAIKSLIDESYARAKDILMAHMDALHRIAGGLIEHETLTGEQMIAYKEDRTPVFAEPQAEAESAVSATPRKSPWPEPCR